MSNSQYAGAGLDKRLNRHIAEYGKCPASGSQCGSRRLATIRRSAAKQGLFGICRLADHARPLNRWFTIPAEPAAAPRPFGPRPARLALRCRGNRLLTASCNVPSIPCAQRCRAGRTGVTIEGSGAIGCTFSAAPRCRDICSAWQSRPRRSATCCRTGARSCPRPEPNYPLLTTTFPIADKRQLSRGARRPRFASHLALFPERGRRESRVRAAPAVSCAICAKESAHEHTGPAEAIRLSLRSGFTAYFELSPVTGLSCHRRFAE
jgi:hypothetical protein